MKTTHIMLGVTIAAFIGLRTLDAQTIRNGRFETPGFTPEQSSDGEKLFLFSGSTFIDGWTVDGVGIDYFAELPHFFPLDDGRFRVDLVRGPGQWGAISQTVTGLTAGAKYYFCFDIMQGEIVLGATIRAAVGTNSKSILNSTALAWRTHEIRFVATDTTTTVSFSAPSSGSADVGLFVDNVRLLTNSCFQPFLTIQVAEVDVCWTSQADQMYRVQYRSELTTNIWTDFGAPVQGTGTTNCIVDTVRGQPRRFYRVVEIP